jgi:serine/threonine protein phosphatase 1
MARFAISDLHGCQRTFLAALEVIGLNPDDELFLLGDFIDRGPNSRGLIDTIWGLQDQGYRVNCLKGNHEQICIDALNSTQWMSTWLKHGGRETMASFGDRLPGDEYRKWMEQLPHFLETEGYILVHAGLNFRKPDPLADRSSMLWIRNWSQHLDRDWLDGRIVVHGHTPRLRPQIEENLTFLNRAAVMNIDAGCCYNFPDREGQLCVFNLDGKQLSFVPNQEIH